MEDSQLGICDECLGREIVYDAILDCKAVRLCRRCLDSGSAIDLGSARRSELPRIALPSSKEVLCKMSGLNPKDWDGRKSDRQSQENINMDYLRMKKRERDLAARAEKERIDRERAAIELASVAAARRPEPTQEQILQVAAQKSGLAYPSSEEKQEKPAERKSFFSRFRREKAEPKIRPTELEMAEGPAADL